MKIRWMIVSCVLCSVGSIAQEYPRELKFSPQEQQMWQLSMQRPLGHNAQTAIQGLKITTPALQAFWWAQRCRFALQSQDKAELEAARLALKQLETTTGSSEFAGSAAGYKCLQLSQFKRGESAATRQLSFLAFHSLTERDAVALHAWVGLDYARDALASGFYDSADQAVGLVLHIARQNQLQQLEADSLWVQAEVKQAMALYPEALRSIDAAMALQTDPGQRSHLQLMLADVLLASGRRQEAQAQYQALWQQQSVRAGLALLELYLQADHLAQAQQLSSQLQQAALQSGERELIAISRLRHAMLLLAQGEVTAATQLFDDAGGWLAQHRLALYLPEQLSWAQRLSDAGQHQAAFSALQHSLRLQRQLDADNNQAQAQLSSTLLIAEQRGRELKLVELQQQLKACRAQADARISKLWLLGVPATFIAALLAVWAWRRRRY